MRKLVTFLIVIAVGGAAAYYYYAGRPVEQAEVIKAAVSRGDIVEAVKATGTIEAIRTVNIGSQVSGIVKEIHADFNDIVSTGQLLAELDPSLFVVQVEIQKANIGQREADIANQEVQLEDVQTKLKRAKELMAKGLVSQESLDAANLAVINRVASIENAKKQLVSAEANLQQAELNLSYTKIYSPIDGVVVNRVVDRGQAVQSSVNVAQFYTIATDLRELRLTGGVDEAEIGKVRPGQSVEFEVDAYLGQKFLGTVENVRLNATVQNNVVTYPVWINVKNPDLKLRPSMTANLDIIISRVTDVIRVPNTALRFRPTTDMYVALGLTPPTPGQGRAAGAGRQGGQVGDPPVPDGRQGATPPATAEPGRGGQTPPPGGAGSGGAEPQSGSGAREGRTGRGDFGAGANLTPEQARQFTERFGGRSGRRGGGAGGRGANQRPANVAPQTQLGEGRIDQYFTPLPPTRSRGTVWTWDAATKTLAQINLTLGVTDGSMSELISGDVEVGRELVTGVILPASMTPTSRPTQGNPFQQGGRGGPGGGGRGGR
jgi:HlyD family secretion protein